MIERYLIELQLLTPEVARSRGINSNKPVFVPIEYSGITFEEGAIIKAEKIVYSKRFTPDVRITSLNGFVAITRVNKADVISRDYRDLYVGARREDVRAKAAMIEKILVFCKAKDPDVHNGTGGRERGIIEGGLIIQAGDELIPVCEGVHPKNPEFILQDCYRDPNRIARFAYRFQRGRLGRLEIESI